MDINVKVSAPELTVALNALAEAIKENGIAIHTQSKDDTVKIVETVEEIEQPKAEEVEEPAKPAVTVVPKWTMEQLAHAGSERVAAGKRAEVIALLNKYGIQSLVKATPDMFNAIGEDLIALGAQL